ncbi:MAG: SGNH/GDSL hydrolase family protein, partial [Candidatus Nanoarchaeia archaeon]
MERDRLVLIVLLFLVCILLSSLVVAGPCGNKVAAVGDSQTAMASYVVELRKLCGLDKSTLKNEDGDPATSQKLRGSDKFAFVGKHTSEMKRDFNAVLEWGPDTMILMGGGNDVGGSPQAIINNLKDMISRAKAKGIRVVSVTFGPFWNDEKRRVPKAVEVTRKVNEWILSPQNPADVKVNTYPLREDPEEKDAANKDLYVSDLVHLNKAGKKIIAEAMFNAMTGAPAVTSGTPYVPSTAAGPLSFPHCEGGDLSRLSEISGISRCYAHKELFDKYAHDEGLYDLGVDLLFTMLVAMGESGCMTSDEMAAKFTQGDHKSYGGIFQVDDPCRFKKSCVTLDLEIQEGMKELKRKFEDITDAATKRNYKLSAEDFALLWLFTYNRGWGTGSAALDRMVGGLSIQDATDHACASFYGYADGRPGKVKCSSGTRCKDGHLNDYRFYCGKRPAGGVYYASSRYGKYKKLCEQIGGRIVTQGSSVRSGQQTSLGPAPTLPSAYSYGVNADVLAPYSVIPSFTVAIPSILGLFEDAVEGIEKMDTCAGDLTCINGMISSMDNRPGSVRWLGKFAGTVLPQGSPMDALWLDRCETNNEYVLYSVAEALSTLKQATTDDCTLPIQTLPVALEAGATTRVAPSPGVSEPSVISDTGCPPEMANIEGQYCIDKWEAHVVDKNTGEPASPFYSIKPSSAKYQYRHYLNKPSPVQMPELPNV